MLRSLALALLSVSALVAEADYFPLRTGNTWTYRASPSGQTFTVAVTGTQTAGDQSYFVVEGFPGGAAWLRIADDGTLYAWDRAKTAEVVWAAFGTAEGWSYNTAMDLCAPVARVGSRAAKADVPVGQFDNTLQIFYPPAFCADAGLTSELYLPSIGLLQRTQTSFAGPVVFDLVYARLNYGLTIVTAPEQSFQASLDSITYAPSKPVAARLTIRNTQTQPLPLVFPSGQRYDAIVRNEAGEVVYQWSRGRAFTMVFGTVQLSGEQTWAFTFPAPETPGRYTVELPLATQPPAYKAQLGFTVK